MPEQKLRQRLNAMGTQSQKETKEILRICMAYGIGKKPEKTRKKVEEAFIHEWREHD